MAEDWGPLNDKNVRCGGGEGGREESYPDPATARAAITITEINEATTHLVEWLELSTTIVCLVVGEQKDPRTRLTDRDM